MPTYNINSINNDLRRLSWDSDMEQDTSAEEKITIPRAEFDAVLKMMENISQSINNQGATTNETDRPITCCCEKREKFYCGICREMIHSDEIIYNFFNHDAVNICLTCYEKATNKNAFKSPANGSHCPSGPTKKCIIGAPPDIISSTIKEKDQLQIAGQEEGAALEFVLEESHQDLFEFFKGLGTSTTVLQEVRRRYESYEDLEKKYEALLAEKENWQKLSNQTVEVEHKIKPTTTSDGIAVSFDLENKNCIVFTILNDTKDYVIPKNSSLHFRFGKNKDDLTKCYLKLSDKESIQPGSLQILRFNHMFDDYNILQEANYYEIKIMNVDKVLFERTIENSDTTQSKFEDLKNEMKDEEPLVLSELSIDDDYDILSEFDDE